MGLDISVVAHLKWLDPQPSDDDDQGEYIHIWKHDYFVEQADDLQTGFYEGDHITSFRAGSYSGYGEWREKLARMALGVSPDVVWANLEIYKNQAFFELINFADCEGTIGPKTSAKLYQDFLAFDAMAQQYTGLTAEEEANLDQQGWYKTWFYDRYKEWTEAFKIASTENGAVLFH